MTTFQLWIVGILLFVFVVVPVAAFTISALGSSAERKFDEVSDGITMSAPTVLDELAHVQWGGDEFMTLLCEAAESYDYNSIATALTANTTRYANQGPITAESAEIMTGIC